MHSTVVGFLEHRKLAHNDSDNSIKHYKYILTKIERDTEGSFPDNLNEQKVNDLLLSYGHYSASMRRNVSKTLRYFYQWYKEVPSPVDRITLPKIAPNLPAFMTEKEIERLMDIPGIMTDRGLRDTAILETLYATGLRLEELRELRVADINNGLVHVRGEKDHKERYVPIGARAMFWIRHYHAVRGPLQPEDPAFTLMHSNKPVYVNSLTKKITGYMKQIDPSRKLSPVSLRHAFATRMLSRGFDIRYIQELLGHKSVQSTLLYTHADALRMTMPYGAARPRSGMDPDEQI